MPSEEATTPYVSFLRRDQLLKGRICSQMSKFFPLRVDPHFEELPYPEKQVGIHAS